MSDLVFRVESLLSAVDGIDKVLRHEQFDYITEHERPLDVNWGQLLLLEEQGMLQVVTAREGGARIVGYAVHLIIPHHHYKMLVAFDDFYYMSAAFRGEGNGRKLIEFAEQKLRERGVDRIVYHERLVGPTAKAGNLARFFERQGYRPHEKVWIKDLTEWHSPQSPPA